MYSEEDLFNYLIDLYKSGITNTAVLSARLEVEFEISTYDASAIIGNWLSSFQKPECINCD